MASHSVNPYIAPPPAVIAIALIAIQKELEPLVKSATNDEYDSGYVPLEDAAPTAHKLLTAHDIAVLQPVTSDADGRPEIETILVHSSGEYFMRRTRLVLGEKQTPQGHMSAITYMRRGALMSTIGMTGRGEDDDGNKASGVFAPVTEEQVARLRSQMKFLRYPKTTIASELFNIKTRDHAYLAIKRLEETIAQRVRDEESKDRAHSEEFGKPIDIPVTDGTDDDTEEAGPTTAAGFQKRLKALGLAGPEYERKVIHAATKAWKIELVMKSEEKVQNLDDFLKTLESGVHALEPEFYAPTDEPRTVEVNVA